MALFSEQFIYQVQQATDIVDLIGQYVALKRRGREFLGLCPFHDDKKPSMNVSPTKQIFKCFACGAGGTAFNFLMLYEKLTFPEAVRMMAERANIPLPQQGQSAPVPQGLDKTLLLKITTFAMEFFRKQLKSPAGAAALSYARNRGLSDESIERFFLGYAPDSWDSLLHAGGRAGFGEEQMIAAGLSLRREHASGCYDRFRNRLIFPIFDATNRVIAFGGRALAQDEKAKYLNSPETPLFDKSSQLFALNWSRERIVSTGQAIVVEGYLDALIPHQAGVDNVVATLGTSLTDRHVRILSRYAREVVLIFDADVAGAKAAERALEMFLAQQVQVRVATIPAGKDPCDYCLAQGAEAMKQLVSEAPDALQYAWSRRQEQLDQAGANLADRRLVVEDFLRLVVTSATYGAIDEVRKGQLAQHMGHMLNIQAADLQQIMRRLGRRVRSNAPASQEPQARELDRAERRILEVLLNSPELFDNAAERVDPQEFTSPELRAIAQVVWHLGAQGKGNFENLLSVESLAPYGAILADLATEGEKRGNYEKTLDGAVETIMFRRNRQEMQNLKSEGLAQDDILREIQQRVKNNQHARRRPTIR